MTVRSIAAGGSGVAELPDGRVVFVPRTAPGDRARVRIERSKRNWATASLQEIIEPGPHRRDAPCPLYHACAGCQLQHLPYELQLESKARIVVDALERIGKMVAVSRPEVVPSPRTTEYRNRMAFTLRRLQGGRVVAGLHALHRPTHVVDIAGECLLPRPELKRAWCSLREAWGPGARHLPAGGRLRLALRWSTGCVALVVEGGAEGWSPVELTKAAPDLVEIWHRPAGRSCDLREVTGSTPESAPVFTQVNPDAAVHLLTHVIDVAGRGDRAVDAYGGTGQFGRALADKGWAVTGIEVDAAACREALSDAPPGLTVREGRVEELLAEALPADLVIVNPPRTGLGTEVVSLLAERPVSRLVYVSCDPATLARDVASLSAAYAVDQVRCFDLFPQTAHVETVLVMSCRDPAP